MKRPQFLSKELGLSSRLLIWFLAIALIPCGLITLISEVVSTSSIEKTVRRGLIVASENKTTAIDNYIVERRGHASLAGNLPSVMNATRDLNELLSKVDRNSDEYKLKSAPFRRFFSKYRDTYGYENAYLFGLDGRLLIQVASTVDTGDNLKSGPLKDSELADLFGRARSLLQAAVADFQIYPGLKKPISFVGAPIFDFSTTITAWEKRERS